MKVHPKIIENCEQIIANHEQIVRELIEVSGLTVKDGKIMKGSLVFSKDCFSPELVERLFNQSS